MPWKHKLIMVGERKKRIVIKRNKMINESAYPRREIKVRDFIFLRNRGLRDACAGHIKAVQSLRWSILMYWCNQPEGIMFSRPYHGKDCGIATYGIKPRWEKEFGWILWEQLGLTLFRRCRTPGFRRTINNPLTVQRIRHFSDANVTKCEDPGIFTP